MKKKNKKEGYPIALIAEGVPPSEYAMLEGLKAHLAIANMHGFTKVAMVAQKRISRIKQAQQERKKILSN